MVKASAAGVINVPGAGGGDGVGNPAAASASPPECRMRRRRRLARQGSGDAAAAGPSWVRRLRPATSRFSPSSSSTSQGSADEQDADPEVQEMELAPLPPPPPPQPQPQHQPTVADAEPPVAAAAAAVAAQPQPVAAAQQVWPLAFGSLSMAGRMRIMEDTVSLHPDLCTWPIDGSPVHFFAVFDGHGGSHVSALCRERMHEFVAEELGKEGIALLRRRQAVKDAETSVAAFLRGPGPSAGERWSEQAEEERAWRAALMRSFRRVDAMAALACACGRVTLPRCGCPVSASGPATVGNGLVGSTAVVALLVRGRLIVANCGDSRAVLCRAGAPPVPLSFDHKPNRPDEMVRIQAAGGRVLFNSGYRVRGILAMSRAIGDRLLRPEVIAEPEITITDRTAEDECLILATDGMWDVIDNDIACSIARQCLEDGNPPPPTADPAVAATAAAAAGGAPTAAGVVVRLQAEPRCLRAASLLARLAIGRETQDNISIIVVDLKHRE